MEGEFIFNGQDIKLHLKQGTQHLIERHIHKNDESETNFPFFTSSMKNENKTTF